MFIFHIIAKLIPASYLSSQFKKPAGLFGKIILAAFMDKGNAEMHNFTLELMDIHADDSILEIGFGTGKILRKIKEVSHEGFTAGIDFSKDMVDKASKFNSDLLKYGKLEIKHADVSDIPYKNNTFDKIYTANTLYFWPDPVANAKEIMRVLKKKGKLYIAYRLKEELEQMPVTKTNFKKYSENDLKELFKTAGFKNFEFFTRESSGPFPSHTAVITKQ